MRNHRLFLLLAVTLAVTLTMALAACSGTSTEPPAPAPAPEPEPVAAAPEPPSCPNAAGICFDVTPDDAQLRIDQDDLGAVRDLSRDGVVFVQLDSGIHQVTLKREGYVTWRAEVMVNEAAEIMQVKLEPEAID